MPVFSATFNAVNVTAAQDVFEIAAPADSMVLIREIVLGQYSDAGDAQDELLSILLIRGHTTTGSGGSTPTPVNFYPRSRAALSTVKCNDTGVAANGTTATLVADAFNVRAGWVHRPPDRRGCIVLDKGQRLVARITAPVDALTMNGTLIFEEVGDNQP
jgi:hypothetical protein